MNYIVRYTKQAEEDLYRNAAWWAKNHSLDQALKWEAVIKEQLETLQQMPERHSLAPENSKFPFEVREKPIGLGSRPSYRAVYTIERIGGSSTGNSSILSGCFYWGGIPVV